MTNAQARELCRGLLIETFDSLRVAPRMRSLMSLGDDGLKIGADLYPLSRFRSVRVVSVGKAAIEMAGTAAEILGKREQGARLRGIVVAPGGGSAQPHLQPLPCGRPGVRSPGPPSDALAEEGPPPVGSGPQGGLWGAGRGSDWIVPSFQYFQAGHPYPNQQSMEAADAALALLEGGTTDDLVLFLISGGGSALMEKPLDSSMSLDDMRQFHELLVTSGAGIQEMNVLRKHLSAVKGGRLAQRAAPATQVTIYVSDVPDHLPSAVASGPTMPDETTVEDCLRIARRYGLLEKFPNPIRAFFDAENVKETPKPGDACFAASKYYCLMSNRDGVGKLRELARSEGIPTAEESCDDWPVERAAAYLLERLETLCNRYPGEPVMLVSGGELSCPVPPGATGRGGRNQAFVLECVAKIAGKPVVVLSAGTDGIDGNSPAAGAVADGESARRATALGLDAQEFRSRFDSYGFFEKLNDAIVTGPTGANVRDLRMLLSYSGFAAGEH